MYKYVHNDKGWIIKHLNGEQFKSKNLLKIVDTLLTKWTTAYKYSKLMYIIVVF